MFKTQVQILLIFILTKIISIAKVTSSHNTLHCIILPTRLYFHYIFISPQLNSMTPYKCILFYIWILVRDDRWQFHNFARVHGAEYN